MKKYLSELSVYTHTNTHTQTATASKQRGLLRHNTNVAAQKIVAQILNPQSIDLDFTRGGFVQMLDKRDDGRLPASRGTDQCNHLSRRRLQGQTMQNLFFWTSGVEHFYTVKTNLPPAAATWWMKTSIALKCDFLRVDSILNKIACTSSQRTLSGGSLCMYLRLFNLWLTMNQFEDLVRGSNRLRQTSKYATDGIERVTQRRQIQEESHELTASTSGRKGMSN